MWMSRWLTGGRVKEDSTVVRPGLGSGVLVRVDSEIQMLLRALGTSNGGELHGSTIVMQQPLAQAATPYMIRKSETYNDS
jgi:hypothetical protein